MKKFLLILLSACCLSLSLVGCSYEEPSSGSTSTTTTSRTVYVSPSGSKYHYSKSCCGKNAQSMSLSSAISKGYTACGKCVK